MLYDEICIYFKKTRFKVVAISACLVRSQMTIMVNLIVKERILTILCYC